MMEHMHWHVNPDLGRRPPLSHPIHPTNFAQYYHTLSFHTVIRSDPPRVLKLERLGLPLAFYVGAAPPPFLVSDDDVKSGEKDAKTESGKNK